MIEPSEADALGEFLRRTRLAETGGAARFTRLSGGVSSDIWRVDLGDRSICVKRPLAHLRVAAEWRAPVTRNLYEWRWFCLVNELFPGRAPRPLARDARLRMLATEFLPPTEFRVWKADLLNGETDARLAGAVGAALGAIHAATAFDRKIARRFDSQKIFFALRIEAYLLATARAHPALAPLIEPLAVRTAAARIALVHGDVSPKNIMIGGGARGPVFLDAETAVCGDPAFDLAFCLNHFLLKAAHRPEFRAGYAACYGAFAESYLARVEWEAPAAVEARAAGLLAVLHLARIDGKSPVEYITDEPTKARVREFAAEMIRRQSAKLADFI